MDVLESAQATLEIIMMEEWMDDECKCESAHVDIICSSAIVARKTACHGTDILICQNSVEWNKRILSKPFDLCDGCLMPCKECWKIIPV